MIPFSMDMVGIEVKSIIYSSQILLMWTWLLEGLVGGWIFYTTKELDWFASYLNFRIFMIASTLSNTYY